MAESKAPQSTPQEPTQASNAEGTPDPNSLSVVGIGASAGGIRALQTFFQAMSSNPGIVFVVVMHLSPDRDSALPQVLQAYTAMPVQQVQDHVRMESDHVYVIPPNQHLKIADGHLNVSDFEEPRWQRAPIDVFFVPWPTPTPMASASCFPAAAPTGQSVCRRSRSAGASPWYSYLRRPSLTPCRAVPSPRA